MKFFGITGAQMQLVNAYVERLRDEGAVVTAVCS
jgi:hypothetical protein